MCSKPPRTPEWWPSGDINPLAGVSISSMICTSWVGLAFYSEIVLPGIYIVAKLPQS